MKVCIIGIQNIKHMTLISLYTQLLEKREIPYDVIYIDKYGTDENTGAEHTYKFRANGWFYQTLPGKLLKGFLFRKYAIEQIEREKYDFLILWREQTASIFAGYCARHYKGRYCVNVRDLFGKSEIYLNNGLKKAVSSSAFNTISSDGFREYLPKADYLTVHSANIKLIESRAVSEPAKKSGQIVITYIGMVRFKDYCIKLIEAFKNDKRFLLKFIGQGSDVLREYAEKNSIGNVVCIGQLNPEDTMELICDADIINCAFGAGSIAERRLMPIRFYYALYKKCCALTTEGTWVDAEAKRAGIGISIPAQLDADDGVSQRVFDDYMAILGHIDSDSIDDYIYSVKASHEKLADIFLASLPK